MKRILLLCAFATVAPAAWSQQGSLVAAAIAVRQAQERDGDRFEGPERGEFNEGFADYFARRIDDKGHADWRSYGLAYQKIRTMPPARRPITAGSFFPLLAGNWSEIGPANMDVPYTIYYGPSRPLTGRVTSVAWDPTDINKYFISAAGGGVWKTTDDGSTWSFLSAGATWPHMQVGAIAVDPKDGNKVYAGLGDARGSFRFYSAGIMVSGDAGATWALDAATAGQPVSEMAIDPRDGTVLATTGTSVYFDLYQWQWSAAAGGVYMKKNAGFAAVGGLPANTVWTGCSIGGIDRNGDRMYYVSGITLGGGGGGTAVVYGGKNGAGWANLNLPGGAIGAFSSSSGVDVSASPVNYNNVYAINGNNQRLYKYDVPTAAWNNITNNHPNGGVSAQFPNGYNWSQANYDIYIHCAYTPGGNRDVLYSGLITLCVSDDEGATWTDLGKTYQNNPNTHNDQQCAAFSPKDPTWVLFGNDGGVYATKYDKRLRSWGGPYISINKPNITQFYHGDVSTSSSDQATGGSQDNASPRSYGANSPQDGQAPSTARWNNSGGGDGGWTAVDPTTPLTMYTAQTGSLWGTTDGWTTAAVGAGTATVFPMNFPSYGGDSASFLSSGAMDPSGRILFFASTTHIFRYTKGNGTTAASLFDNSASGVVGNDGRRRFRLGADAALYANSGQSFPRTANGFITTVAVAPGDGSTLMVGTSDGYLWLSKNALNADVTTVTFTRVDANLPLRSMNQVVMHPFDSERAWVVLGGTGATNNYCYKCEDTTGSFGPVAWNNIDNGGLPQVCHNTVQVDTTSPHSTLYVGNDCGVFMTTNNGGAWTNATVPLGLPNVHVNELVSSGATGKLTAFTFGRGVWQIGMDTASIRGFGFGPATLKGGNPTTCRVVLWKPAGVGGTVVTLNSANNVLVPVPATVTVPAGATEFAFGLITGAVGANTTVPVTATIGTESRTTNVRLTP